ncbi:MAG: ASKHA domain-containing protein, partial [Methylobacter sp.]
MTPPMLINVVTPQGEIELPFQSGATLRDILIAGGVPLRSACAGNAACGQCQVRVQESAAIAFTAGEISRLSPARLNAGWRLACQIKPLTPLHVSIKTLAPAQSWRALREDEYSVSERPLPLRSGTMRYGVAIDLGTTHIRLSLWDLRAGKRLAGRIGVNPQDSYGADILTRLTEAARSKQVADALARLVRTAIAGALLDMSSALAINLHDIGDVIIVGNTAMLSLLSGKNTGLLLDPDYWTQRFAIEPDNPTLLNQAWRLSAQAHIRFMPPLGGFMGSDLLAGIIATRLQEQPAGSLLIDFGTNSEMALWDGKKLRLTSTAGGPAFEGCGISCGMSAEAGAIYRVSSGADSDFKLDVLGTGKIKGLCGSGLVDAVAWLRRQGKVDKLGRYLDKASEGLVLSESRERIVLKPADI